jgi:hypothetical protein
MFIGSACLDIDPINIIAIVVDYFGAFLPTGVDEGVELVAISTSPGVASE